MKWTNSILLGLSFVTFSSAMATPSFNVALSPKAKTIDLAFTTRQVFAEMCTLDVVGLYLEKPAYRGVAIFGHVTFTTRVSQGSFCLMAGGPHRGKITLTLGENLPDLPVGQYDLTIDNEQQGVLTVDGTNSYFEETPQIGPMATDVLE